MNITFSRGILGCFFQRVICKPHLPSEEEVIKSLVFDLKGKCSWHFVVDKLKGNYLSETSPDGYATRGPPFKVAV